MYSLPFHMGAPSPRITKCLTGSEGVMEWIRPTTTTWKIINIFQVKNRVERKILWSSSEDNRLFRCNGQHREVEGLMHCVTIWQKAQWKTAWFFRSSTSVASTLSRTAKSSLTKLSNSVVNLEICNYIVGQNVSLPESVITMKLNDKWIGD